MEPDREKIENLNKEEIVELVAGTINATGKTLFWKNELELIIDVGNYTIVENMNGYDLIKVAGIIKTTKKEASKFSNTKYNNMKKVTRVLVENLIKK